MNLPKTVRACLDECRRLRLVRKRLLSRGQFKVADAATVTHRGTLRLALWLRASRRQERLAALAELSESILMPFYQAEWSYSLRYDTHKLIQDKPIPGYLIKAVII